MSGGKWRDMCFNLSSAKIFLFLFLAYTREETKKENNFLFPFRDLDNQRKPTGSRSHESNTCVKVTHHHSCVLFKKKIIIIDSSQKPLTTFLNIWISECQIY